MELIIGIVVLGVVLSLSARMLLHIQKDNIRYSRILSIDLQMNNTLDSLQAYLLEASKDSITYGKNFISWSSSFGDSNFSLKSTQRPSNKNLHTIILNANSLYFDGFLMLDQLSDFEIFQTHDGFKIKLCTVISKKPLCRYRLIRLLNI
ncbi:hypothetical protein [Helicobacter sp. 13S00482-2]|uniref:hypothetical protein n=1 Tax=Helicobacter sp. 13S00482-2 TaxID=1476200 RepID=UPI001179A046|nr:hypothetical protein [Helicobacter sp. 13S00482-2]